MTRTWIIGSRGDCDAVVNRPHVSGQHCRLTIEAEGVVIEDLGSAEGTFVNGTRIASRTRVTPGDAITLGPNSPMPWPIEGIPPSWKILQIGREPENDVVVNLPIVSSTHARLIWSEQTGTAILEDLGSSNGTALGSPDRRITRSVLSATDTVFLGTQPLSAAELLAPLESSRAPTLTFQGPQMVLGRDPGCDRVLDLPFISGRHARLTRSGGHCLIEDLGSSNGTYVNGRRLERGIAVDIHPGDVIALGSHLLRFAAAEPEGGLATRPTSGTVAAPAPAPAPSPAPVPYRNIAAPSSFLDTISGEFRESWTSPRCVAALVAPALLTALGIVLFLGSAGRGPDHARSIVAALFGLGYVAVATGLLDALIGFADPRRPLPVAASPRFGARLIVLTLCIVFQCMIALAIVHIGMGLKGPWIAMLGLLILASTVGLSIGLALLSMARRPAVVALGMVPMILLLMWLLGGHWRPLSGMNGPVRGVANALPARWAFEGLLLMEAAPPVREGAGDEPARGPAGVVDLAEAYFPAEDQRMGVRAATIALGAMLLGLIATCAYFSMTPALPDGSRTSGKRSIAPTTSTP